MVGVFYRQEIRGLSLPDGMVRLGLLTHCLRSCKDVSSFPAEQWVLRKAADLSQPKSFVSNKATC